MNIKKMDETFHQPPLVSIIVISFNHEKFITHCLDSILQQSYPNIEIIVVDNNSSDASLEKLEKYALDIYLIKNKKNLGMAGAINQGMLIAKGTYITFFAADDKMVFDRISKQVAFMHNHPEAAGCFGNALRINEDDSIHKKGMLPTVPYKEWSFSELLFHRIQLYSPTQLYRTDILKQHIGVFNEDIGIEDVWLYYKLLDKGYKLYSLPYLFTFYRIHSNNTHSKIIWMMRQKIKILLEYEHRDFYSKALSFLYLEHFSALCSTSKKDALRLLPKVCFKFNSKYLYIGLFRLIFDWR